MIKEVMCLKKETQLTIQQQQQQQVQRNKKKNKVIDAFWKV